MSIRNNGALSSCSCGIGALLATDGVAGDVEIHNNLPGCNSPSEILTTTCSEPTAVEEPSAVPERFALRTNYPNPFNSQTTITFALPVPSEVQLIIYDTMGRVVTTLIRETLPPGTYHYTWQGQGFSNGAYFYRLEAGAYTETRSMLLVK